SSPLPRGAREYEVPSHAGVRREPADHPPEGAGASGAARSAEREGACHGRLSSRSHADPRRQRRVCPHQQELWLDDAQEPARRGRRVSPKFNFKGKSGKVWKLNVHDRRIAKVIRACQDLPGQELFQYIDADGEMRDVTSSDVNAYLREIC